MKQKILWASFLMVGLAGCGKGGNADLIPLSNRVQATAIAASFVGPSAYKPAAEIKAAPLNAPIDFNLEKMKGKVVVVDFWATWCGPCRMEIPAIEKMYETYHAKGLEIWGLSVQANDGQSKDYFNQFISGYNIHYPIGLASSETLKAYGINPIPTTFFIDKSGKIALSFVGVHPEEDFTSAIEKLLAE